MRKKLGKIMFKAFKTRQKIFLYLMKNLE
jgi:hypothetical protein